MARIVKLTKTQKSNLGNGAIICANKSTFAGVAPINVDGDRFIGILTSDHEHMYVSSFIDQHHNHSLTAQAADIPLKDHWIDAAELLEKLAQAARDEAAKL